MTPVSSEDKQRLIAAARDGAKYGYAPYSGFRVGAAVLLDDGRVVVGCNVENASYGLTVCAERAATFKALSEGGSKLIAVAVSVDPNTSDRPFPPCGACRQVLAEFMDASGVILVDRVGEFTLGQLLPEAFTPDVIRRSTR